MKQGLLLAFAMASVAEAQVFRVMVEPPPVSAVAGAVAGPRPVRGSVVDLDPQALRALLDQSPMELRDAPLHSYGLELDLPGPGGELVRCVVAQSPVMEAALAARYPEISTYIVQSADRTAVGRVELSPRGLTGMLRTPAGVWVIDPWQSADPEHVIAYWLRDLPGGDDWVCHTGEGGGIGHGFGVHELEGVEGDDGRDGGITDRALQPLRTVRLAVACTGEYGQHYSAIQGHAPNVADPLAAIVTAVSRANVAYESDIAVHFNLVANNDQIVFFDPNGDPYDATCGGGGGADCSGNLLGPNMDLLSSVIGNANFDVGHVLTRIFGGVAYLQAVCQSYKGGAVSGMPRGGDVEAFAFLVMIHELGHQFGANHTFSGTRGRCQGNVRLSSAWEAGSGSSPMAYAGGCPVGDAPPSDNVVQFADPFFHHGSVLEMQNFLSAISCPVQTATSNNLPVINSVMANLSIPPSTPFVLTAAASDADGDALTYSWEQFDSGFARPLSGSGAFDNGVGSLFRIFPPVTSSQRTFPRMADVLSGVATPGEMLPTATGATRQFRVIVRDNHAGVGGVAISPMVNITIAPGTTAFAVTAPVQGAVVRAGNRTVKWTVGGTSVAPVSCSTVTIRLSTDDGATFPQVLGMFPNNGAAVVTLPSVTAAARVRVEGNGNIFFAVSRPFLLRPLCAADFNNDGAVDFFDYDDFVACFEGAGCPTGKTADFNNDTAIDFFDYDDFVVAFEAGC